MALAEHDRPAVASHRTVRRRAFGDVPGLAALAAGFLAFLYLPIGVLVAYSFNAGNIVMVWTGFSTDWYARAFANADIRQAALNSLVVALTATAIATVCATLAALAMARGGRFRGQEACLGLITLPLMVPEIVTAVAVLVFFSNIGLNLGLGNVIIAHVTFCIPFAFMPIRARLAGMDTTLEQASRDLYASEWETFRLVTLPLLMPGVLAGAMLSFVVSMDDFIITLMVAGAGDTTLPVYIYSMIRQGITPEVNAVSSILLVISILVVIAYWFTTRKTPGSSPH
ncbi:ABC transporter permease [Albidovulum sp.]|jgi:spermidine/putrescine transport system permease protein|uniref:ABC transporter permease n=1 Tax=Albidovulum sp. TaxID=1872424 RepID=UPI003044D710